MPNRRFLRERYTIAPGDAGFSAARARQGAGWADDRQMQGHHPFNEDRPDDLPVSAEVWDAATRYTGSGLTAAFYRPIKQLETEIIALRPA